MCEQGASQSFITVTVKIKEYQRIDRAKLVEVQNLVKLGTFEFAPLTKMSKNGTALHSRFVLTIKNFKERTEYFKARLAILGHIDPEKLRVVNEALSVLKRLVRLLFALILSHNSPLWY